MFRNFNQISMRFQEHNTFKHLLVLVFWCQIVLFQNLFKFSVLVTFCTLDVRKRLLKWRMCRRRCFLILGFTARIVFLRICFCLCTCWRKFDKIIVNNFIDKLTAECHIEFFHTVMYHFYAEWNFKAVDVSEETETHYCLKMHL